MKKYNNFKEYMEDVYYDEIFNRIKGWVYAHKNSFESDIVYYASYAEPYDIHVSGVTFKEQYNASCNVFFRAKLEMDYIR